MKIVLLCDDFWHPGHVVDKGLGLIAEKLGADIKVFYDAREFDAKVLKDTDLFVFAKSDNTTQSDKTGWINDSVIAEFEAYVANGGGFIAVHSGTVYNSVPRMKQFLGGGFLSHPEQCPVRFDAIAKHPVTKGVEPFNVVDERGKVTEVYSKGKKVL